ncbi:hypothetical protein [Kineosporia babensis]|uniref:Ricin B lectin domain-containing protein n=1 Tax=Kineosporia babensis TaxID=499548 RepID=A0A9X1SXW6_9ACTN|nr:hypothetical protein [Kineosporia babensis]MCD5315655.1 hypothetical protein [Kineosporia babensis]
MFTARLSRRSKVATAVLGVPAVAAGMWLSAGTAQATSQAEPISGKPVLIKAGTFQGKDRIVSIGGDGKVDLKRSKPTKSNGLSSEGTTMVLKKVGKKNPMYQIMSSNDSHEIDAYCVQQKKNGSLNIAVCDKKKANQLFDFAHSGAEFSIEGKYGYVQAAKRSLRLYDDNKDSMTYFSVTKVK